MDLSFAASLVSLDSSSEGILPLRPPDLRVGGTCTAVVPRQWSGVARWWRQRRDDTTYWRVTGSRELVKGSSSPVMVEERHQRSLCLCFVSVQVSLTFFMDSTKTPWFHESWRASGLLHSSYILSCVSKFSENWVWEVTWDCWGSSMSLLAKYFTSASEGLQNPSV